MEIEKMSLDEYMYIQHLIEHIELAEKVLDQYQTELNNLSRYGFKNTTANKRGEGFARHAD